MRVVFVPGACVRDGSWWWHGAASDHLARPDVRVTARPVGPAAWCDRLLKVVRAPCG